MDPVFEALEHYRLTASPQQKASDLKQLEQECLEVDAKLYIEEMLHKLNSDKSKTDKL